MQKLNLNDSHFFSVWLFRLRLNLDPILVTSADKRAHTEPGAGGRVSVRRLDVLSANHLSCSLAVEERSRLLQTTHPVFASFHAILEFTSYRVLKVFWGGSRAGPRAPVYMCGLLLQVSEMVFAWA